MSESDLPARRSTHIDVEPDADAPATRATPVTRAARSAALPAAPARDAGGPPPDPPPMTAAATVAETEASRPDGEHPS